MSAFTQDPATQSPHAHLEASPVITAKQRWTGRVLTTLVGAFLVADGGAKLFKPVGVVQATVQLGYPASQIVGLGIVLLACTILYLIPRTSVLGAVLLTGYLGGAVATNLRVSGPWFNILFPVFFGFIAWAGLYLRDGRMRSLLK
jgi:DoxX-like family